MVQPNMLGSFPHQRFGEPPVGCVSAFAGALGPPNTTDADVRQDYVTNPIEAWGWMACDGRALSSYEYPELFAVLGYTYGGSGDHFCIPDYRGSFLRGNDTGTQNAPNLGTRVRVPELGPDPSLPVSQFEMVCVNYIIKFTYGLARGLASG